MSLAMPVTQTTRLAVRSASLDVTACEAAQDNDATLDGYRDVRGVEVWVEAERLMSMSDFMPGLLSRHFSIVAAEPSQKGLFGRSSKI